MKLIQLRIQNFRSIKDSGDIRIEALQALVGENNAGKSNILSALDAFLISGAAGVAEDDCTTTANAGLRILPVVLSRKTLITPEAFARPRGSLHRKESSSDSEDWIHDLSTTRVLLGVSTRRGINTGRNSFVKAHHNSPFPAPTMQLLPELSHGVDGVQVSPLFYTLDITFDPAR
jgi:hypothetical protein